MYIYRDIVSGDEILTDALPMKDTYDGSITEVSAKYITLNSENDFDIGGNPGEEEPDEVLESTSKQVIDAVHFGNLTETSFDKKSYMGHIKKYMANVKAKLQESKPDRVAVFQKGCQEYVKFVLANFDDFAFYLGESMNPEAMCIACKFSEDGMSQTFYFVKDGMTEEKV
eukprot:NODE_5263_length_677_cov_134.696364_g5100_i0.p1 GENE.NODE_5263_length_677_cov_134.696364_g5100_i0~~NODE_5263_length_677_cov_134.696364_g5100_i0.p1  ORF type:complete len:188 (+),score=64.45 NODE_5263_length_677_cov_134.696364_g5100_i0:56-565(+)